MRQVKYLAEYVRPNSTLRLEIPAISLIQAVGVAQEHNRQRRSLGLPSDYRIVAYFDVDGREVRI